jgi:predicted metal-dependent hydrolase
LSPDEPRSIDIGGHPLAFDLRRSNRRTLSISVEPDQRVVVTAPAAASEEKVAAVVRRRAQWIRRQQRAFDDLPPPANARQWIAGETHRYLGRQYRLRIDKGAGPAVRLSGSYFLVTAACLDEPDGIRIAMDRWYRYHAEVLLNERVNRALKSTTWLNNVKAPTVSVRRMTRRWGSTTRSNRIYFNLDLVKAPLACIEYVVMHELVHLRVPHHGPAYWRLLSRCMPDWQCWRERLARLEL